MSVQRSPTFLAAAGALLVVGGFQAPVALAGARSSSCAAIEASEGPPLLVVPDGATPALEPQDVLDRIASGTHLRRAGHGPASAIPCLEYVPADPGAPANSVAGRAVWVAHVEARFWIRPPFAAGGCRSEHGLVTVFDTREPAGGGVSLLDPRACSGLESRLTRGR